MPVALHFLPRPAKFLFGSGAPMTLDPEALKDPVRAEILDLCINIDGHCPPTAFPDLRRLHGNPLRDINYIRYYGRAQSIRLYFYIDSGWVVLIEVNESKRRTKLTDGEEQSLKQQLDEAKRFIKDSQAVVRAGPGSQAAGAAAKPNVTSTSRPRRR